ncbi:hypothetical protein C9374_000518 [Naegleria lovaniensis]|uniref:Fe2OG dioxygenase domain-containing protein n=1 Tax=Naegleria lovaniensis TaxID=51637 RepID=A0AA88GZ53_NAELO|nr:uncharacterized protein C9374_000518 [Naegleria lovaniensis]KAG2388354.1 hypothetical protein C9374_000518 [Naegleria lovaniensis]
MLQPQTDEKMLNDSDHSNVSTIKEKSPPSPTHSTSSSVMSSTSSIVSEEMYSAGTSQLDKLNPFRASLSSHDGHSELPPTLYYIPNFITEEKEQTILNNIYAANSQQWTRLRNRRLQMIGGKPNDKVMFEEGLPKWLTGQFLGINDLHTYPGNKTINHVLINEYEVGQGIDYHKDGPVYFPMVFIISLESTVMLNFKLCERDEDYVDQCPYVKQFSVIAEPRSLLIFTDDIYHYYMHGIDECDSYEITDDMLIANAELLANKELAKVGTKIERSKRLSLTCRCVRKTMKKKLFFK